MLKDGGVYVGDLPCQWCDKDPMKATWDETITTTAGTNGERNKLKGAIKGWIDKKYMIY